MGAPTRAFCRHNTFTDRCPVCSRDIPADVGTVRRTCIDCGGLITKSGGYARCPKCRRAGGGASPDADPSPVIHLRVALERARIAGVPFADAWPDALRAGLALTRSAADEAQWHIVLEETLDVWRDAYDRTGRPLTFTHALIGPHHDDPRRGAVTVLG